MKFLVVNKLLVLILLLTVTFAPDSRARNNQSGGHGGGQRVSHGAGSRVASGGGRSSGQRGHSGGHLARAGHFTSTGGRSSGAVSAHRTAGQSSAYPSSHTVRAESAAQHSAVAHDSQRVATSGNGTRGVAGSTEQRVSGNYASAAAQNSSRANLSTANGATGAEWSRERSPQWHEAVANRQQYWNRWTNDNHAQLQRFQATRNAQWSQIGHWWNGKNVTQVTHTDPWNTFRNNVSNFRDGRRVEIWNGARWYDDNLFDNRWWASCGWYPTVAVGYWNPWWWWTPCDWGSFSLFLGWGSVAPVYYDCGVNWVDEGDIEYFDGQPIGSESDSAAWAAQQADPPTPPAPTPPGVDQSADWKSLGVWALTQEQKGDAFMFMQLSVNKGGVISGAYSNVLTDEKEQVVGRIDKATQKAAFRFGANTTTTIETGAYNLTQDVASCFVRFGTAPPETWLLVRLPAPAMPNAPTRISTARMGSGDGS
jgi:hypothetical protein